MGERDAFGREKGEDPLAELGWRTSLEPDSVAEPVPERAVRESLEAMEGPEPVAQAPRAPDPVALSVPELPPQQQFAAPPMVRVRRRRPRRFAALILVLAIVVIVAGSTASLIQIGADAVDDLEGAIRDAVPTAVPPAPTGVQSGSLLRPTELKAALAKLPAGEIELLRVAPERIDAQVVVDGQMHIVQVRSDGGVSDVTTPATGRGEAVKVNSAAPSRIVRTAARRAGRDPETVSYLVLSRFADSTEWQLFFADGLHFSASANGKKVRRVG